MQSRSSGSKLLGASVKQQHAQSPCCIPHLSGTGEERKAEPHVNGVKPDVIEKKIAMFCSFYHHFLPLFVQTGDASSQI